MTQRDKLKHAIAEAIAYDEIDLSVDIYDVQRYLENGLSERVLQAVESLEPQWHKFDIGDETTWPEVDGSYWVVVEGEGVQQDSWLNVSVLLGWANWLDSLVTHWMPITVPSPPESDEI